MAFTLSPKAVRAGYRVVVFETVGSTSQEALERARAGEAGPLWLVSDHQTSGRGRRGSAWETPSGNLAASLLLTTDRPAAEIARLGFVAGIGLARALESVSTLAARDQAMSHTARSGADRVQLKWPNDVTVDGAKLAGILLETDAVGARRSVSIGIGVNVAHVPDGLPYPAASLSDLGYGVDAAGLFSALSDAWVDVYARWAEPGGFASIRADWLRQAAGLGGAVAVRTGAGVTRGVFETIDEHGQLVVRVPDGTARTVSAGEVHFGMAATAPSELYG